MLANVNGETYAASAKNFVVRCAGWYAVRARDRCRAITAESGSIRHSSADRLRLCDDECLVAIRKSSADHARSSTRRRSDAAVDVGRVALFDPGSWLRNHRWRSLDDGQSSD